MRLKELKARMVLAMMAALLACCALGACGTADSEASSSSEEASTTAASESSAAEDAAEDGAEGTAQGDAEGDAEDPATYVGTWSMHSIDDGNEELFVEDADLDTVAALNLSFEFNEDGTAIYRYLEQELPGVWKVTGENRLSVEFENVGDFDYLPIYEVTREGDLLVIKDGDITMKLKRA